MRGETWALIRLGKVTEAAELLGEARATAEGGADTADEQAEIAYLTAVCCYTLSTMAAAHVEFARALALLDEADGAERPAALGHPPVALALLPAPARLGGRPRGHRARPRARRGTRTTRVGARR